MLLKIGTITFNLADIHLIVPGAEKTTVFLSTTEGGRTASLDRESAEKLELFLSANGRVDLDGPAFKHDVFEAAASFREQAAELEAILLLAQNKANLEALQQRLASLQNASARLPPEPVDATKIHAVPKPAPPPLPLTEDDPDPMTFVRRGPKIRNPLLADL